MHVEFSGVPTKIKRLGEWVQFVLRQPQQQGWPACEVWCETATVNVPNGTLGGEVWVSGNVVVREHQLMVRATQVLSCQSALQGAMVNDVSLTGHLGSAVIQKPGRKQFGLVVRHAEGNHECTVMVVVSFPEHHGEIEAPVGSALSVAGKLGWQRHRGQYQLTVQAREVLCLTQETGTVTQAPAKEVLHAAHP